MALIKCNECGKDIAENAIRCPYCGGINEVYNKKTTNFALKAVFFAFLIPIVLSFFIFMFATA